MQILLKYVLWSGQFFLDFAQNGMKCKQLNVFPRVLSGEYLVSTYAKSFEKSTFFTP